MIPIKISITSSIRVCLKKKASWQMLSSIGVRRGVREGIYTASYATLRHFLHPPDTPQKLHVTRVRKYHQHLYPINQAFERIYLSFCAVWKNFSYNTQVQYYDKYTKFSISPWTPWLEYQILY